MQPTCNFWKGSRFPLDGDFTTRVTKSYEKLQASRFAKHDNVEIIGTTGELAFVENLWRVFAKQKLLYLIKREVEIQMATLLHADHWTGAVKLGKS